MLLGLAIRDLVLIDRLDLAFGPGLCVLSGETGAGKSILLDALGLALGLRAESGLVRAGAAQAVATAEFALADRHPARAVLAEAGFDGGSDRLVLRRVVGADGRSRAFIDDQPASIGLLARIGDMMVEVHGQFDRNGLLDPATHRDTLDAFGNYPDALTKLGAAWAAWRDARTARETAEAAQAKAKSDEAWLRHVRDEIAALDPKPGEETGLAQQRSLMSNREKIAEALDAASASLSGESGERAIHAASRALEKIRDKIGTRLDAALAALERAAIEAAEASAQIDAASRELGRDARSLEAVEERLFALRGLARKHGVAVDALADLGADVTAKLALIEDGGETLGKLQSAEIEAKKTYRAAAETVSQKRRAAAQSLDKAVMKELPPLKLEAARFVTALTPLEETEWSEHGAERIRFEVATNKGAALGPLAKILSGGELSRFMLAIKVVLAKAMTVATLVFDEVDSGIGGATAASVGDRLRRLAKDRQILVVTHSPQVAALGQDHWRVEKSRKGNATVTTAQRLDAEERREEIARMLSGSAVTAAARAAAESLMNTARA
ncbi:MAG TPA: DNA repair protein RecN [Stellaceae bacterium]|jgi:DNA repair protein RecN (Recombination protein N)